MARQRALSNLQGAAPIKGRPAEVDLSEEEATNTESQLILKIGSLLKKPKSDDKDVQQFRARVATDRKQSETLLDQRVQETEEQAMRRRNEITATILDALQTPNRPVRSETTRITFAGTTIADNAAYISVANVLAASDSLSKEYERLDSTIKDIGEDYTEPVAEIWQQELQDTERQLQMGARVASRNVRKVLGVDVDMGKGADEDGEEQEQNDGDAEHELNYELQRSLRYVERGVKRMVKGLPNEE